MKWLPGGWQRADRTNVPTSTRRVDPNAATAPRRTVTRQPDGEQGDAPGPDAERTRQEPVRSTRAYDQAQRRPAANSEPPLLLSEAARDIDVSAAAFRNLAIGGGISGFLTVLCAAALANSSGGVWLWVWQIVFGAAFLWFVASAKGSLSGRGFLMDRSGVYPRTRGEVYGISWNEITAVGVGSLRLIENKRLVHPERRRAFELFPADSGFPARHPELERWRVEEPPPMSGLPAVRYRFHLPAFSRLPHRLEHGVQAVAPRAWVGQYRLQPPQ